MAKRKRVKDILTDEAFEKYERIINCSNDNLSISECWNFLDHLKSSYQVHDFWLSDLSPFFIDDRQIDPPFSYEGHASRVFMELLKKIMFSNKAGTDDKKQAWDILQKYFWSQIKRIQRETNTEDKEERKVLAEHVMLFLYELAITASQVYDVNTFNIAFLQLAEFTKDSISIFGENHDFLKTFKGMSALPEFFINLYTRMNDNNNYISISHPKQVACYAKAIALSEDDEPLLILGETGTGKESIAHIIHLFSRRRDNVFFTVNCGGFTDSLFNSEIQGIIKKAASDVGTRLGAFLTACSRWEENINFGYYVDRNMAKEPIEFKPLPNSKEKSFDDQLRELAGTLFLDEINSLSEHHQAALLRIIQTKEVQVVGEDQKRPFHLKLVCASNSDLASLVQNGSFREDLYYRIYRGVVELPPLRDLKNSFSEIVEKHVSRISKRIGLGEAPHVRPSTINKLKKYDWPGNMRELENVIYRGLMQMRIQNETQFLPKHIELLGKIPEGNAGLNFGKLTYAEVEKLYVDFRLKQAGGNKSQAARDAQIERNKFQRILKHHGLF